MLRNGGMIAFVATAVDWVGCSSVLELTAMMDEKNDMIRISNSLERSQMRLEISETRDNKQKRRGLYFSKRTLTRGAVQILYRLQEATDYT